MCCFSRLHDNSGHDFSSDCYTRSSKNSPEIQQSPSIAVEPLGSAIFKFECTTLPAVCAPVDGVCRVAMVNPSSLSVVIKLETLIAAVNLVVQSSNAVKTAATVAPLSKEEKLRKVLYELQIDGLPDATSHKQPLICHVTMFIDTFAENHDDVGTTSLTFNKIDTADIRPLRQPVRRLPYGEIRAGVESEVDKLVSAGIAR